MKCLRDVCGCWSHIDPDTHVPCCPYCRIPLIAEGACPNGRYCPTGGTPVPLPEWVWLPRDVFHGDDLPPANGWRPVTIPPELTEGR